MKSSSNMKHQKHFPLMAILLATLSPAAADWPTYRGDAARTGGNEGHHEGYRDALGEVGPEGREDAEAICAEGWSL